VALMIPLTAMLVSGSVFLLAMYIVRAKSLNPSSDRIRALSDYRNVQTETGADGEIRLKRGTSAIPVLARFLNARGYSERWANELERAGLRLRPGEYFLIRLSVGLVVALVIAVLGGSSAVLFAGGLAGIVAFLLPAYYLRFRIKRRRAKIDAQLVETMSLVANGLKGGFAFAQSIDVAGQRVGPPISSELSRMLLDVNLGAGLEEALSAMNERVGSDDMDMVVTAILIQRNTGGNLAEVLENVTETMRDRERIQGEIKTLTSQQRLTGWILSLWPAALAGLFFLVNHEVMSLMWTTSAGLVLLVIWVVLNLLGIFTIQRILDIDI
jgi:tight adherence protein B